MTTIVTIKTNGPAVVISERLSDRERFENGRDELQPGVEQVFVIHEGQSVRVVEFAPEPALPEAPTGEAE